VNGAQVTRRRKGTPATNTLLAVILIVFAIDRLLAAQGDISLAFYGGVNRESIVADHEYWRLITAIFLHGGALHLAVNLFALFQLGKLYEIMFGTRRFLLIYFASGLGGTIASTIHPNILSVGASGAIFGLLGAFIFSVRRSPLWRNDRMARSLVVQCVFWMIANLVIGFLSQNIKDGPRIDNAAHLGGLVVGLLLGLFLPQPHEPPPPPAKAVIDVMPYDD